MQEGGHASKRRGNWFCRNEFERWTPNVELQTPNPESQVPSSKPQTPGPKPQTCNPKARNHNHKPQVTNPKPLTNFVLYFSYPNLSHCIITCVYCDCYSPWLYVCHGPIDSCLFASKCFLSLIFRRKVQCLLPSTHWRCSNDLIRREPYCTLRVVGAVRTWLARCISGQLDVCTWKHQIFML